MNNFEQAIEMIKKLQINLSTAYEYFLVRDALKKAIAPNIKWKDKAEENLEIINNFIRFFWSTIESNRKMFALELSKFFDTDKRSLSLDSLINFIQFNIKDFNKENFILYNKDISLKSTYEPITNKILNNIKLEIKSEENLIKKLRKYRSKSLAHNDIKSQNIELFVWEIDNLFKKTQKRLNTISSKIYKNTWRPLWKDTETEDCVYHIINKLKK